MAELERKIASYEEAAIQANRSFQAKEEKMNREINALRRLLDLSGADPMVVEQHSAEGQREGVSEEMDLRNVAVRNSGSFYVDAYADSRTFQFSNVSLSVFVYFANENVLNLDIISNTRG